MSWSRLFYVPLFFFCSGYTTRNIDLRRKARGLLVPYITFNILMLVFTLIFNPASVTPLSWLGPVYGRFCLYPYTSADNIQLLTWNNAPVWFLPALFTSFILLKPLISAKSRRQKIILAITYIMAAQLMRYLPVLLPWSLDTAPYFAIIMWAGYLTRRHNLLRHPMWMFVLVMSFSLVLRMMLPNINLSVREYGPSLTLNLIGALAGSISFVKFCLLLSGSSAASILARLNAGALSIFALQMPFMSLPVIIIPALSEYPEFLWAIQLVTGLAAGYATGVSLNRYAPYLMGKKQ